VRGTPREVEVVARARSGAPVTTLLESRNSTPGLPLRPYQREAVDAVRAAWERGTNRVAMIMATGGGKTVCFAHMVSEEPGRTLVLAHRKELVDQAAGKIAAIDPDVVVGVEMATRNAGPECQAVVASVQTLASRRRIEKWPRDAFAQVVVDEAHHSVSPTYLGILEYFGCFREGGTRTLGVTATLARGDKVGLGSVWQEVAYERSVLEMVADGYLVNPKGISVPIGLDLDDVDVSAGDYAAGQLGDALTEAHFETAVAQAYATHAPGRPGLVFTPTVATAQAAAQALREAGFKAEAVWGAMDPDARDTAIKGLRNGGLDVLCNCAVLTEGTDIPRAEVAVMARPTRSAPLFVQMCGRVLRPYPGKTDALILDLVGTTADNKLCTLLDLAAGEIPDKAEKERPEDGETLTEAVERVTRVKLGKAVDVDLFGTSKAVWLRTDGGHWFAPAGKGYVALYPDQAGERWALAEFPPGRGNPRWSGAVPDLALAMALGEQRALAIDRASARGFSGTSRTASWRSGKQPPSPAQLDLAARMRLDVPDGATKAEVADLITVRRASPRVDRHFANARTTDTRRSR
jgi:superfamily II DNA or RNA helicase